MVKSLTNYHTVKTRIGTCNKKCHSKRCSMAINNNFFTVIMELGTQYGGAIWSVIQLLTTLVGLALMEVKTSEA